MRRSASPGKQGVDSEPLPEHEPLSRRLARVIEANSRPEGATLNELLESTGGRGAYLIIILLSLPFILPVSIPGVSTVFGIAVALLSLKLALGHAPKLPGIIGNRRLSAASQKKVLAGGVRILRLVERLVRPRRTPWMSYRLARFGNGVLMMFMGLLLAVPFPPLPPLTNALPCYCIILLAASMMEEDGVTIWFAYALTAGTAGYLILVAGVLEAVLVKAWTAFQHWLGQP